jgi:hypothetical protein
VYVEDVPQPLGGVVESGGSREHEMSALVSPDPPSRKFTCRS